MSQSNPSNDQPSMQLVLECSNVSLIPYKSSWYTQHFQQVAREKKMKSETWEFLSSTIQSILFGLYNHFIFQKALWKQERDQMQKVIFDRDEEIESLKEKLEK